MSLLTTVALLRWMICPAGGWSGFDIHQLMPLAEWSLVHPMLTKILEQVFFKGVPVAGFIMQNWERIVAINTAIISIQHRARKLLSLAVLDFPGYVYDELIVLCYPEQLLKLTGIEILEYISTWRRNDYGPGWRIKQRPVFPSRLVLI